jgi:tetratricopeptide (TPR) repeat protein
MYRFILLALLYSCFSFFSLSSVGQAPGNKIAAPAQYNEGQQAQDTTKSHSQAIMGAQISVARLGVPRKARRSYEQAMEAWQKQDIAGAQRKVDQALKTDPGFPEALALKGFMQASQQNWRAAEENLQAAIRSDSGYYAAYIILAGIYNTQGRYDEAQESAQKAISAGADSWSVRYEIARVLIGKGEYQNALAVTDVALRSKHGSLLHVAKAHALLGLRRYPEAAMELRDYLRYQPAGEAALDAQEILNRLQSLAFR